MAQPHLLRRLGLSFAGSRIIIMIPCLLQLIVISKFNESQKEKDGKSKDNNKMKLPPGEWRRIMEEEKEKRKKQLEEERERKKQEREREKAENKAKREEERAVKKIERDKVRMK